MGLEFPAIKPQGCWNYSIGLLPRELPDSASDWLWLSSWWNNAAARFPLRAARVWGLVLRSFCRATTWRIMSN